MSASNSVTSGPCGGVNIGYNYNNTSTSNSDKSNNDRLPFFNEDAINFLILGGKPRCIVISLEWMMNYGI
jgi:hypothetical protein